MSADMPTCRLCGRAVFVIDAISWSGNCDECTAASVVATDVVPDPASDSVTVLAGPQSHPPPTSPGSGWHSLVDEPVPAVVASSAAPVIPAGFQPVESPVESSPAKVESDVIPAFLARQSGECVESIFNDDLADDEDVFGMGERRKVEIPPPTIRGPVEPLEPGQMAPPPTRPSASPKAVTLADWQLAPSGGIPPAPNRPPVQLPSEPAASLPNPTDLSQSEPIGNGSSPPGNRIMTRLLLVYAVVVTLIALVGWLRGGPSGHPLSVLPDIFGEYGPAERQKVSGLPDHDVAIPAELIAKLGQTLELGQLEFTPLSIAAQPLVQVTEFTRGSQPTKATISPGLVLKVRLKNRSTDLLFHPVDPAFNRKAVLKEPAVVGVFPAVGRPFIGGPIAWPFAEGIRRVYMQGQETDDQPLTPGESREFVIPSSADRELLAAVQKSTGPTLWKVQVRRGRVPFGLSSAPVTALVGVQFTANQVNWSAGPG